MKHVEELRRHPERFEVVSLKREDGLDDICVVRKATGEVVAQNLANALAEVERHPECFDVVRGVDETNRPVTRFVRKLTGEVAVNRYHFSDGDS